MPTQKELDVVYMRTAELHSTLSKAIRKKVGACLVTPAGIIIPGYNGTPSGTDNTCEISTEHFEFVGSGTIDPFIKVHTLSTKPDVIHAELNCILKAALEGISIKGSTLYVTLSPCVPCAAFIVQSAIKRVVYKEVYRCTKGIEYLESNGIIVEAYREEI